MCVQSQPSYSANLVLQFKSEENVSDQQLLTGMRPFLNLATLCERYILEPDGGLTLFRIIDRFTIVGTTPEMPIANITFNLVVGFRAGEMSGPLDITISVLSPDAQRIQEVTIPVIFEAPQDRMVLSVGQMNLSLSQPGQYWIVIKLAEEEYTRIPLKGVYQRQPTVLSGG